MLVGRRGDDEGQDRCREAQGKQVGATGPQSLGWGHGTTVGGTSSPDLSPALGRA